jgi:hypothetical protein
MHNRAFTSAALIATLLLSGCGIGFNAGTQTQRTSGMGASVTTDAAVVRDAVIVADPSQPGIATIVATFIAVGGDNSITAVTADGLESNVSGTGTDAIELPESAPVQIGFNSEISVVLSGDIATGTYVPVTFTLASGDPVVVSMLVFPNKGIYSEVTVSKPVVEVTPLASATPMPSAS